MELAEEGVVYFSMAPKGYWRGAARGTPFKVIGAVVAGGTMLAEPLIHATPHIQAVVTRTADADQGDPDPEPVDPTLYIEQTIAVSTTSGTISIASLPLGSQVFRIK